MNIQLNLGLTGTILVMASLLGIVFFFQFTSRRYIPSLYWLMAVLISIVGTLITDNLEVPLEMTTLIFSGVLALTFVLWYAKERTLSVHTITTRRRESFYWLAILFTFALGTAAGDLLAERLNLGYALSALVFATVIALVTVAHLRFKLNAILAFWIAYIVTHPLGASLGDLLSQSRGDGGLGVGATLTSMLFLGTIFLIVTFLSVTRKDTIPCKEVEKSHLVDSQTLHSHEMMEAMEVQAKQGKKEVSRDLHSTDR